MRQPLAVLLILCAALAARLAMGVCVLGPLDEDIRYTEIILIGTVVARDPGERYVIFVGRDGTGNRYAYECWTPYTVRSDSTGGEFVIYKGTFPLLEFTDSTIVWGMRPNWREGPQMKVFHGYFLRRDNGARVTESEFIETLGFVA